MIIVRLIGGLGNQMFQYAAGRSFADRHGVQLKLDATDFARYTIRHYELSDFLLRAEIASEEEILSLGAEIERLSAVARLKRRIPHLRRQTFFRERSFRYDDRIEKMMPPLYMDGYWQSEKYFLWNAETLQHDFSLRSPIDPVNSQILKRIADANAISLHVRRGDYVSDKKTNQMHGVCSLEYYNSAIQFIAERIDQPHFFVFSDDHEWVRNNLCIAHPLTIVTTNSRNRGILDMELMKHCKHHIIANSSFSWWGAWLNLSKQKIVIAPKKWFNKANHDTNDLIPSAWVKL